MSNTSGRATTLKTSTDFPNGESWLTRQKVKNSEGNAKQKRIALEQFDEFLDDYGYTLDTIDNDALESFSIWLDDEKGLAHSTLPHRWYAVRAYLNKHIDTEIGYLDDEDSYILEWIDGGTKTTQEQDKDIHWLPQDMIGELIDGAKNLKNRLVIQLLWHTGCRPSEVARMKHRRLDRENRCITVQTSKVEDSNAENYERDVFYGRSLRADMREWMDHGGRASYPYAEESPYLVVGYNTPGIGARQVNKIVRLAAKEAEIQEDMIETAGEDGDGEPVKNNRVVPKTLRHSFAVHSVRGRERSGSPAMDLERLRRLMGHASLDTTRQYLQFRRSELRDAYDQSHPG
ncbi:tyrosine-type recombinase/integrase [Natrarchaeobius oligotrophus]|uniref:tyrosine-type recombinase/integrase n=1 Tax=Natrarchaeobius oligotrophus TaxID=3455743 RepID=UPI0014053A9B|nr:site-specific integrase [Natrarchaeobius chitinivorans]